ncbi:hypothetical protein VTK56DRAFT_3694 [Thermocarpiscus australiensis]
MPTVGLSKSLYHSILVPQIPSSSASLAPGLLLPRYQNWFPSVLNVPGIFDNAFTVSAWKTCSGLSNLEELIRVFRTRQVKAAH